MFQARDSSICHQILPSPCKSRSFLVTIISCFAAYNVESEGHSFTGQMKIAGSMKNGTGESEQETAAAVGVDQTSDSEVGGKGGMVGVGGEIHSHNYVCQRPCHRRTTHQCSKGK